MRVAIIHYWLLNLRGGEKVIEALCRLLPEADIFTLFYDPERMPESIRSHSRPRLVPATLAQALPRAASADAHGARKLRSARL